MKVNKITPHEFCKLKLSEAIPYYIADIKKFKSMGVEINMDSWTNIDKGVEPPKVCSVCAGGAAILGFFDETDFLPDTENNSLGYPIYPGEHRVDATKLEWDKIINVGNSMRLTDYRYAVN